MVEFAIVLPLLVLLVIGFIEFGILMHNKQVITNASREGARAAITPVPELDPGDVVQIVQTYSEDNLIYFGNFSPVTVSPPPATPRSFGEVITITVTWDYNFLLPAIIGLGPTITLGAETKMRMM